VGIPSYTVCWKKSKCRNISRATAFNQSEERRTNTFAERMKDTFDRTRAESDVMPADYIISRTGAFSVVHHSFI